MFAPWQKCIKKILEIAYGGWREPGNPCGTSKDKSVATEFRSLYVADRFPSQFAGHRARELGIYDDRFIPGLKHLVAELHACAARVSIQVGHGGCHTREDICGEPPIAPSAILHPVYEATNEVIVPSAMTKQRIEQTPYAFVDATWRAQKAGFDCVELHAAHSSVMSQFLCPEENRRTDEYGGSLENRARFGLDILRGRRRTSWPVIRGVGSERQSGSPD